jgi:hypothetical protein
MISEKWQKVDGLIEGILQRIIAHLLIYWNIVILPYWSIGIPPKN